MIHVISFNFVLACCLFYSLRSGGRPEKAAMLTQTAAALFTIIAIHLLPRSVTFTGVALGLVIIDIGLLVALAWLALSANRLWTIVLAGLQLSTMIVHLSKAVFPALPAASYGIFAQFWAWPMLLTTAVGIHCHRVRTRRFGEEPDWKPLWPHSARAVSTI
jgi:hypothetical protein